ncbi:hypothetical protein RSAG8_06183, partial [Rhizoctonia solani AG-8 WAC10335]
MQDDPDWQLSRNRSRRLNIRVPLGAVQSQEQLSHARNNNTRHDYGREIAARLPSPVVSDPHTHAIVHTPLHIDGPPPPQEPGDEDEDEDEDDPVTERDFANQFIDHLAIRDGADYRAEFESGEISLLDLRNMVTLGQSPPRRPRDSAGSANYVHQSDPAPLDQNVPAPNVNVPASNQVGPGPIATDLRGNNAWPGSRFVGDGYNPPTNVTTGPANNHVPVSRLGPLRRTDRDTIVPGSPHPMSRNYGGQAPAQPVPVPQVPSGTGNAPVTITHQQTNPGHMGLVQPGELPAAPMAAPMTPKAPCSHKILPPHICNMQTASQPVLGFNTTPGSAPIATPTPASAPTGPTLTANNNIQSVGHNIRGGQGNIHFTTYNNATHNLSHGYGMQATHKPDGRQGQLRPVHVHPQPPHQPQVASPALNPLMDAFGPNASHQGLMATGTLPVGQNVPPPMGDGVFQTVHITQPAQSLAYPSVSMADRPMPMLACQPPITQDDVPADFQAAMFAQPSQLASSHHSSMPQGTAWPQVACPQPMGAPFQPLAHAAQPPLPTGYGYAQQVPQAPRYPYVPQYVQGPEGGWYTYGPQYGNMPRTQNGAYPQPYITSAQLPGVQAMAHHQHMAVPPQIAPQIAHQAALHAHPRGAAPVATPPGVPMDVDVRGGDGLAANPAPAGNEPNINLPFRASTISSYPIDVQPVLRTFVAICQISRLVDGTYPDEEDQDEQSRENVGIRCWHAANRKHKTNYPFKVEYLKPVDASMCAARCVAKGLLLSHTKHCFDLRQGEPEHNIEVKNRVLPHGIHEGIPEEACKPMESQYLKEACHLIAYTTKRSIGIRHAKHFAPPSARFLAYICTLPVLWKPPPFSVRNSNRTRLRELHPARFCTGQWGRRMMMRTMMRSIADADADEESWDIVADPSGAYFLVGAYHTVQIDPSMVDNILNGHISAQEILEIAIQSAAPSTSQAGPSGLSNAEKEVVAAVSGIAHIETVGSDDESGATQQGPSDPQVSRLYNGRYLDDNGGVEQFDENEDQAYYAGIDAHREIEPIIVSDEEMELDKDD